MRTTQKVIGKRHPSLEEMRRILREAPLAPLRQILTDADIYGACWQNGYDFRERLLDPVVTVFQFLLQALNREESFAATCPALTAPLISAFHTTSVQLSSSATSQARSRLPRCVLEDLVVGVCETDSEPEFEYWKGLRLVALDCSTVSMPSEAELFAFFGRARARKTTINFPLATISTLLAVGTSLVLSHNFGPYDRGEHKTALPLLKALGPGDLLLADRHFSGSPTLARLQAQGVNFLMRKNARLIVERLPVLKRLGRHDFITEIAMDKTARCKDPSLPPTVRVRIFKAHWRAPSGERLTGWFVTSLKNARKFQPAKLAKLYHRRWQIETSYLEFKVTFHGAILRSKTVENIHKEFLAHLLAYQLLRRMMLDAARKHHLQPTQISILNAARWVLCFAAIMRGAPATMLPTLYQDLLDAIALTLIDVRPGRLEPRALARECKHYLYIRIPRSLWRRRRLTGLRELLRLS